MYLIEGFEGYCYVVESIEADTCIKNVLKRKGIMKNSILTIRKKRKFYPYVMEVNNCFIAIEENLIKKIKVHPYA